MRYFTCFGEVLWDIFPNEAKIGGAPLNVAFRLKTFENNVAIISAVGKDVFGEKLIQHLDDNLINTEFIQTLDNFQTGKVNVILDEEGTASYEIQFPAAWDHIQVNKEVLGQVAQSEVFVFGSLACRNSVSRNTLFELLKVANFKVFDVNLRPPYFSQEILIELMRNATFIKFNEEELELIAKDHGSNFSSIEDNMTFISNSYGTKYVCVTKGGDGAILLIEGNFYYNAGYKIIVKDTVGAGDSFLGTLINNLLSNVKPQAALDRACAVGTLVAGSEGANPDILERDIINLIKKGT
jgi:fructokinase